MRAMARGLLPPSAAILFGHPRRDDRKRFGGLFVWRISARDLTCG